MEGICFYQPSTPEDGLKNIRRNVCESMCVRANSMAMKNTIFYLLPTAALSDPHRSCETPKKLADKRGLQGESEF